MTMHLDNRLSTISTKVRKTKITKGKLAEYELRWRKHNKWAKQRGMHSMRYATLDAYIDYCHGKAPKQDVRQDRSRYVPATTYAEKQIAAFNAKYPESVPKLLGSHNCSKKETMQYTGDLIQGIATMHKSNAVPVMKGTDQAIDIARMRR